MLKIYNAVNSTSQPLLVNPLYTIVIYIPRLRNECLASERICSLGLRIGQKLSRMLNTFRRQGIQNCLRNCNAYYNKNTNFNFLTTVKNVWHWQLSPRYSTSKPLLIVVTLLSAIVVPWRYSRDDVVLLPLPLRCTVLGRQNGRWRAVGRLKGANWRLVASLNDGGVPKARVALWRKGFGNFSGIDVWNNTADGRSKLMSLFSMIISYNSSLLKIVKIILLICRRIEPRSSACWLNTLTVRPRSALLNLLELGVKMTTLWRIMSLKWPRYARIRVSRPDRFTNALVW